LRLARKGKDGFLKAPVRKDGKVQPAETMRCHSKAPAARWSEKQWI
jgi:hypothetical protein